MRAGAISANSGKPFDAIISDPPYGRRERTISALGASDGQIRKSRMQLAAIDAAVVLTRLCASRDDFLRQGGRLVYFLPTNTDCTQEQLVLFIPTHPALRLVEVCRQPINQRCDDGTRLGCLHVPPGLLVSMSLRTHFNSL